MNVLITGGAGFIGSHLADRFLARGDEVYVMDIGRDNKIRHNYDNPRFHVIRDSVLNVETLDNLVFRADLVYHLAAVVGVEEVLRRTFDVLQVNVNGTYNVVKLCYKYNKRLVFSSTSEAYGKNTKVPFDEDDDKVLGSTRVDRWSYAASKIIGEHYCLAYHKMGLPVSVIRYFNIYGPRMDELDVGRVVSIFIGQIIKEKCVKIIGDGKQTRCFTYIDDGVEGTYQAGVRDEAIGGIFNIGSDVEVPIVDLAKTLIEVSGKEGIEIKYVTPKEIYNSESYEDVSRRVPKVTRMNEILGVRAETSLEEGLKKTWDYYWELVRDGRILGLA